jgi:hypothetical protein
MTSALTRGLNLPERPDEASAEASVQKKNAEGLINV